MLEIKGLGDLLQTRVKGKHVNGGFQSASAAGCFEWEPRGSRTRGETRRSRASGRAVGFRGYSRTSRGCGTHSPVAGREPSLRFYSGVNFIPPEVGFLKKMCFLSFFFKLYDMVVMVL